MLRRWSALALAIVLAALPSLSRICLTGCDANRLSVARAEQSNVETAAHPEGGDKNCPLHANQAPTDQADRPDAPAGPSPCQHQQELASANDAQSRNLVFDSANAFGILPATTLAEPVRTRVASPIADRPPISPPRPSNLFVLRI
jgi:hypothetical protein